MLPSAQIPQMTPILRQQMKGKFPELQDEDLPIFELSESELVARIARRSGQSPEAVRRVLYEIGVFVRRREAVHGVRRSSAPAEESLESGVPDDTSQSGLMGLGPGW